MAAFAYLRKSSVRDPSNEISHEVQERAVRDLAKRYNDNGKSLTILSDWNISGRKDRTKRPGYNSLLEAIEEGRCTAVYSYSLSRLARSVKELSSLIAECVQRGIPVRLYADSIDTSTASGKLLFHVLSSVAEFEADVASERVRAALSAKLARGETIGTAKPFGDHDGEDASAVLAAFRATGSYSQAAKLLNEQKVKPRNAKPRKVAVGKQKQAVWWPSSVRVIVRRLDPTVTAFRASRGYHAGGSAFLLARLLRCPTCDALLSGTRDRLDGPNKGRVRYSCRLGTVVPHLRKTISEHLILPKIREEAERLWPPGDRIEVVGDADGKRAELEARRLRILDMYESGAIDKSDRQLRLDRVDRDTAKLDSTRMMATLEPIDWSKPPKAINKVLRAMFEEIILDEATFQPIRFKWAVPKEWRR